MGLNDPGKLIYKCRLCGRLHQPTGVPNVRVAMESVVTNTAFPKEWDGMGFGGRISVVELHNCDDEHIGISDLVGAKHK